MKNNIYSTSAQADFNGRMNGGPAHKMRDPISQHIILQMRPKTTITWDHFDPLEKI